MSSIAESIYRLNSLLIRKHGANSSVEVHCKYGRKHLESVISLKPFHIPDEFFTLGILRSILEEEIETFEV